MEQEQEIEKKPEEIEEQEEEIQIKKKQKVGYEQYLKQIKMIQRNVLRFLGIKKFSNMFEEAQQAKEDQTIKEKLCEKLVEEKSKNMDLVLRQVPYQIWLDIFMFLPNLQEILNLTMVCHLFKEICEINILWMPVLKNNFPRIYEDLDFTKTPKSQVNWRALVKEKQLVKNGFKVLLKSLYEKKDAGNVFYKEEKYDEARTRYTQALDLIKEDKYSIKNYEDVIDLSVRIDHYKIIIILLSNLGLVNYKLDSFFKARMSVRMGMRYVNDVKQIIAKEEESDPSLKNCFEENFGDLKKKLKHRMTQIEDAMPIPFSFYHHSSTPVQSLRVGTMLTHNNGAFGGGIFHDSKVFMITFNRDMGDITGVIINKKITTSEHGNLWIGGPCELGTITTLHNVPNVENAKKVIDGVWMGGDVSEYRNNPQYTIRDYRGYASWFSGQLDGEILNGNGWELTNTVLPGDVFEPETVHEMDPYDMM